MSKIAYRTVALRGSSLKLVEQANQIIADYERQGYSLTLRQLYYQFVSRDLIQNKDTEYKRLGEVISNARYAGLISWRAIEDRTRNLAGLQSWVSPASIIGASARGYRIDKWATQPYRVEIWVEKEALAGIVQRSANAVQCDYMACRGYMSSSEMWEAAQRFIRYREAGQVPVVLHIGDHDPSGVHMSEDIYDRIAEFMSRHGVKPILFERLALNMDQVEQYNPPPNPAKLTDSRCADYIDKYGPSSWELDALEPSVLDSLMTTAVMARRDEDLWATAVLKELEEKKQLEWVRDNWASIREQAEEDALNGRSDDETDDEDESDYDEE